MSQPADLKFDHVSKGYKIRQQTAGATDNTNDWLGKLRSAFRAPTVDFWAVNDVSFEVPRGQALGIIGHNGAGKSTLMKLLSGITAPTVGEIMVQGRIAALLEVGSGFHPELTGRENIFLSGSILGMSRREIHAKFDSIVDFAEIRPFIDVPVKRFSSGMYVRLGFSIAAHLEPDVLLLDEVLAVGDAAFQKKCKERILALKHSGITIVFISHDLAAVEKLCDRALIMQKGQVIYDGAPEDAVSAYQHAADGSAGTRRQAAMVKRAEITRVTLLDASGKLTRGYQTGDPMTIRIEFKAFERLEDVHFHMGFVAESLRYCEFSTGLNGSPPIELPPGEGAMEFVCERVGFQPGAYRVDAWISQFGEADMLDHVINCATIAVISGLGLSGVFHHPHTWRMLDALPPKSEDVESTAAF